MEAFLRSEGASDGVSWGELRQDFKAAKPIIPIDRVTDDTHGYVEEKQREADREKEEQEAFDRHVAFGPDVTKDAEDSAEKPLQKKEKKFHRILHDEKLQKRYQDEREAREEAQMKQMLKVLGQQSYRHNEEYPGNPIPDPLTELSQEELLQEMAMFDSPTLTIFGSRGTGKTWIARNLMYLLQSKYPFGMVISASAFTGFWQQHVPAWYVMEEFNPGVVNAFMRRQRDVVKAVKDGKLNVDPHAFIILDDIIHDERFRFNEEFNKIYVMGRHMKITIITLSQKVKGVNTTWRSNTDIAFILQQYRGPEIDTLFEEFGNVLDKRDWRRLLELNTLQHRALVVFNKEKNGILANRFRTFRAVDPGPFLLGCREFWHPPDSYRAVFDVAQNQGRISHSSS